MTAAISRLQRTINDYKARLLANEDQAHAELEKAHDNTLAVIQPRLDRLYQQIDAKMQAGEDVPLSWLYEEKRLEATKLLISQQIDQYAALARTMTGRLQQDGVKLGIDAALAQLDGTRPPGIVWSFGVPSTRAIERLVGATQKGSPLADLFAGWGEKAAKDVSQALVDGVALGNNPRVVASTVQSILRNDVGMALGESRNRALILSRNEMLRCYRGAALETYRANDDTVDMWRWTCAKNKRTCIACIMMDGKTFPLSREFFGHVQCRCSPIPVTKSWDDILGPLGIDTSNIPDTRPRIESGESWFQRQDEELQRKMLGGRRYELWKDPNNDVSLKSFVGLTHDPDWGTSVRVRSLKNILSGSRVDLDKERQDAERKAQEDAERKAKELEERKAEELKAKQEEAKAEAEKKAKEEEPQKLAAQKAAEEKAKQDLLAALEKAKELAEAKAKKELEEKLAKEAAEKALAEKKAKELAEKQAAELKAKKDAEEKRIAEQKAKAEFKDALAGMSIKEKEKFLAKNGGDQWIDDISVTEYKALVHYTGNGYKTMNKALRTGGKETKRIKDAQSALLKSKAPVDMVVTRGYGSSTLERFKEAAAKGGYFQEKGFVSATIKDSPDFSGFMVRIKIFKGAQGAYIEPLTNVPGEREFLLPHGAKFKVVEASRGANGQWVFDVEYRGID